MSEHKPPEAASGDDRRQYVNFGFYKIDPAWRRLPAEDRKRGKCQFIDVVKSYDQDVMTIAYSMIGVRGDCDFMLWRIGFDLLKFQEMMAKLLETGLGNYMTTPYSFLSMTKRSVYVDKHTHTGQEGTRLKLIPGQFRYLFVYPFVKSKAWYRLTKHARQGMMDEHIEVGHRYPTVRLNTTYSFGFWASSTRPSRPRARSARSRWRSTFHGPVLDQAIAERGVMPLPPYIAARRAADDARTAPTTRPSSPREEGAVAAPTAGLHFTPALIAGACARAASRCTTVTLHVGAGTFLPVKADDTGGHTHARRMGHVDARDGRGAQRRARRRRPHRRGRHHLAAAAGKRGRARRHASRRSPARPRSSSRPATASAPSTC